MSTSLTDIGQLLSEAEICSLYSCLLNSQCIPPLIYAEIHLTNRCNANCYFCNQSSLRARTDEINIRFFTRVLDELCDLGLRGVRLSGGGEPSCYIHIHKILSFLKQANIDLMRFDTNGILLTERLCVGLLDANIHTLHVSLVAPDELSWAKTTSRRKEFFGKIINNIRLFRSLCDSSKTRIYISFIIDQQTIKMLPDMEKLANDLNVGLEIHDLNNYKYDNDFVIEVATSFGSILESLSDKTITESVHLSVLDKPKYLLRNKIEAITNITEKQSVTNRAICLAPWLSTLVRANGDVIVCCALNPRSSILGNIYTASFHEIWNGLTYTELREEARYLFLSNTKGDYCPRLLSKFCFNKCGPKLGMFNVHTLSDCLKYDLGEFA